MSALRKMHSALIPGGVLVDTQPVGMRPRVAVDDSEVGALDMTDWLNTVAAVDERVAEVTSEGLFEIRHEESVVVTDSFEDGRECLATVTKWRGTRVSNQLVQRLEAVRGVVTVEQDIRLRLLQR